MCNAWSRQLESEPVDYGETILLSPRDVIRKVDDDVSGKVFPAGSWPLGACSRCSTASGQESWLVVSISPPRVFLSPSVSVMDRHSGFPACIYFP